MVSGIGGAGGPDLSYMVSKMFRTLDTNGDESISSDELSVLAEQGTGIDVSQIMNDLDADGSGGIDASETQDALKKLGETLRSRLGGTEMPRMKPPPDPAEMFASADTDGDGVISRDEFAAIGPDGQDQEMVDEMFASIDSDGDGSISEAEHTAAMEQMGPPSGGMPPPPPPDGMADSEEDSGVSESLAAINSGGTDSIRQLLDALKSSAEAEDEEDTTDRELDRFAEQLENSVMYGNSGKMSLNMESMKSLFSLTA